MDRRQFIGASGFGALAATTLTPQLAALSSKIHRLRRDRPLRRVTFGSCNRQSKPQTHWRYINRQQPDLWIWLGDNIYADFASPENRMLEFLKIKELSEYQRLRKQTEILGIWDDHDFGANNVGAEYPDKALSQTVFCNFLDVPMEHITRLREGIYRSDVYGEPGEQTEVISLDTRYFKKTRREGGMLGEAQWSWLEETVTNSTADLLLIASSIHVTSRVTGFGLEGWNAYPRERERLYDLLSANGKPVIFMSGDRHWAELSSVRTRDGFIMHEIMSSGLTHALYVSLPSRDRVAPVAGDNNFGQLDIDWSRPYEPVVIASIQHANRPEKLVEHRFDFNQEQQIRTVR